jgi:hypothetical protein
VPAGRGLQLIQTALCYICRVRGIRGIRVTTSKSSRVVALFHEVWYLADTTDQVEIVEHVRTASASGRLQTWLEFVVGTAGAGEIAVFAPDAEELERGEGMLAAEHLRRSAAAFAARLVRLRNAFRTARGWENPPMVLLPLVRYVEVEGDLRAPKPSMDRAVIIGALGAVLGVVGAAFSLPAAWVAAGSALIIAYAIAGTAALAHVEHKFERGAGLAIPIVLGKPPRHAEARSAYYQGPYTMEPGIAVTAPGLTLIPFVTVFDACGRPIQILAGEDCEESDDPEDTAFVLVRQADTLIEELESREGFARRLSQDLDSRGV